MAKRRKCIYDGCELFTKSKSGVCATCQHDDKIDQACALEARKRAEK